MSEAIICAARFDRDIEVAIREALRSLGILPDRFAQILQGAHGVPDNVASTRMRRVNDLTPLNLIHDVPERLQRAEQQSVQEEECQCRNDTANDQRCYGFAEQCARDMRADRFVGPVTG